MTRINVIPPQQLCDQHLLAEYRELPRVFTLSKNNSKAHIPPTYRLGSGHVTFFYNKLKWLRVRHKSITEELIRRGFDIKMTEPLPKLDETSENDWNPSEEAVKMNQMRILERLTKMTNIRYERQPSDLELFKKMYHSS